MLMSAIDDALRAGDRSGEQPLAVYVHIPFCAAKCHFCDWVVDIPVGRLRSSAPGRARYVNAVRRQISWYGPLLTGAGYRPVCIYWGGGTPTRLSETELVLLARTLRDSFDLSALRQWSMETTPYDLTPGKLAAARDAGIDRISVGLQSFDPDQLRRSGRGHGADQIPAVVDMIRAAGFANFNVDLICGFPGESREALRDTLERTVALAPPHVSVYPYRATPKTVAAMQIERSVVEAMTAAAMIESYELARAVLGSAGYEEYSFGYWATSPEYEDLDGAYKYSLAGDKIGFGSGAESTIGHHLLWNENDRYADFLDRPEHFSFARKFTLDEPQHLTAPVGAALMTAGGVDFDRFARLTGLSFHDVRRTEHMRRWLEVLGECGASFVEDDRSLRVTPESIHRTYIRYLASTTGAGLDVARA
jgi:oxygen-independent coproporphyrinogen-3 oxidase